jgi:hypothetical protein
MENEIDANRIDANGSQSAMDRISEEIASIQSLELEDHGRAYDQIHQKLESALRSIDGI